MKKLYLELLLENGYLLEPKERLGEPSGDLEVAGVIKSFLSIEYTLTKDSIEKLKSYNKEEITEFYHTSYLTLTESLGVHVKHKIFYKDFPHMENYKPEDYFINAILHYLTVEKDSYGYEPKDKKIYEVYQELHSDKHQKLEIISLEEAENVIVKQCTMMLEQNTAISLGHYFLFNHALRDFKDRIIPIDIPFKENIAFYFQSLLFNYKKNKKKVSDLLTKKHLAFIKYPLDLLRVYVAISSGDITLKENTRFVSLDRKTRRMFMEILENMIINNKGNIYDNFARHEFLWKRALEKLHVGEYKNKYPHLFECVNNFRSDNYYSINGLIESYKNDEDKYLGILKLYPGEFARRLDHLLREEKYNNEKVFDAFASVANKVSTKVLLELWVFFKNRRSDENRLFCIKKERVNKFFETVDNRKPLNEEIINKAISVIEEALKTIYGERKETYKVYLGEELKEFSVPTSNRNASFSTKTLSFGTRIKVDTNNNNFIRLFTHWKNNETRVDVDLSVEFFDETFEHGTSFSWHNPYLEEDIEIYHSGDLTTAPEGASEFIDVNLEQAKNYYRYAAVCNCVYTGQEFGNIPECFSGFMVLPEAGKQGELFNPEFVEHKFDLTQLGANAIVSFVIDLENMEMIWVDSPTRGGMSYVAARNVNTILATKNALKERMNLYDFFLLHERHLTFVSNKEEADYIISTEEGADLSPYDIASIASIWL